MIAQRLLGRRLAPRGCYLLGLLVVVRLILPVAPSSPTSVWNWLEPGVFRKPATPEPALKTVLPGSQVIPEFLLSRPSDTLSSNTVGGEGKRRGIGGVEATSALNWRSGPKMAWICGCLFILALVTWRQWRFGRWLKSQVQVTDPERLALLDRAKRRMAVSRPIDWIEVESDGTPAVFGWRRPRLLTPANIQRTLRDSELELVALHEMAHVRRGDILLNWVILAVQAMHWFNPLVWLAMRRWRADRELVCDSLVLQILDAPQRRSYGETLIKLVEATIPIPSCPHLVSVLNNKHQIERRITMISNFKPTGRRAWALAAAVALTICCLTFTKAAEQSKPPKSDGFAHPATQKSNTGLGSGRTADEAR